MQTIAEFMSTGHQGCDEAFAIAEETVVAGNWGEAETAFANFRADMAKHFRMEEEHLFPSLVAAGGPSGPVQMMRMEHAQMNTLIEQMAVALTHQDARGYGGLSETLLMAMQQHNLKEEQILYPIADNVLSAERESLLSLMQKV